MNGCKTAGSELRLKKKKKEKSRNIYETWPGILYLEEVQGLIVDC